MCERMSQTVVVDWQYRWRKFLDHLQLVQVPDRNPARFQHARDEIGIGKES